MSVPASARDDLRAYLSIPLILWSRISRRRERIAFCTNPTGRFELYCLEFSNPRPEQLTHGELSRSPASGYTWARDDSKIVFGRDQEGDEREDLFQVDLASHAIEPLTRARGAQQYAWEFSPDGRWLLLASDRGAEGEVRQMDFWRIPSAGGRAERLTHHAQEVSPWYLRNAYSPDGSKITYAASDSPNPKELCVYIADSDGSKREMLHSTKPGSQDQPAAWSPDGKSVAFSSDAFDRIRTGLVHVRTREVGWLPEGPYDEIPMEFSLDGRQLLTLRSAGVRGSAAVHHLESGAVTVSPFNMTYRGEAGFAADDRSVVAVRTASDRPYEIVRWNVETGRCESLWTPSLGPLSSRSFVPASVVRYPTFDGQTIEALLFEPPGSDRTAPRPAIVCIHGGPHWQWSDEFDSTLQFLVSQGFVLLLPNIRGSTGYGAQFRDLILFDLGGGDLKDVGAAARYLATLPGVDPRRIGITGVSYGGFMTYIAMTKLPEVWAAGCAEAGITDWLKSYEAQLPTLQHFCRMLMGDPVENAALWADRSPVNFAHQMRAPLLIIHGLNDPRCPILHARVFRDALLKQGRREGVDFEYLEFSDEGHSSRDIEQSIRTVFPMYEFFRRRLSAPSAANPP